MSYQSRRYIAPSTEIFGYEVFGYTLEVNERRNTYLNVVQLHLSSVDWFDPYNTNFLESMYDEIFFEESDEPESKEEVFTTLEDKLYISEDKTEETCPICIEPFKHRNSIVMKPSCKHLYHSKCLQRWIQTKPNCPICRQQIPTE